MRDIGLAKIQEEKYLDLHRFPQFPVTNAYLTNASSSNFATPATLQQPLLPKPQNALPIKRVPPKELQERRDKVLSYTCNEKFVSGAKCKRDSCIGSNR